MTFILDGETPSKKNSRVTDRRTGRSYPSRRFTEWHERQKSAVLLARKGFCVKNPCRINLFFTHGDLRRRDSDNGVSSILDLLVDCGILPDDNWQIVREIRVDNDYMKGNPHCVVTVEEIYYYA